MKRHIIGILLIMPLIMVIIGMALLGLCEMFIQYPIITIVCIIMILAYIGCSILDSE